MSSPRPPHGRRAALLAGGALALGGCSTIEGWVAPGRPRLPGERDAVLATTESLLRPDEGLEAEPVVLPAPEPREDWPQAGGGPSHEQGHPAASAQLAVAWTGDLGRGASTRQRLLALPVVAGGTVYAMDAYSHVSAFDVATGRRRWRIDARPEDDDEGGLGGGLAVEGDMLVVVNGWGEVAGVATADGSIRWRRRLPAPGRGGASVMDGRAFVGTVEGQLTATTLADGNGLWTWRGTGGGASILGIPAPAVDAASVVAAFPTGELVAVRPDNGRVVWVESLAATGGLAPISEVSSVRAAPVIAGGRVIAISAGGLFVTLDLRSGRRVWEREVAGIETPWVAGDWIFLLTANQELGAFTRRDGRAKWVTQMERWENPEKKKDPIRWVGPALAGGQLIMANSLGVAQFASPLTGELLGTLRLPGPVSLGPVVAGGTVFMVTDRATLVALR